MTLDLYRKPRVGEITGWTVLFESPAAQVAVAENHRGFYRVRVAGGRPKYLYGELAHSNARRIAADADPAAYWALV